MCDSHTIFDIASSRLADVLPIKTEESYSSSAEDVSQLAELRRQLREFDETLLETAAEAYCSTDSLDVFEPSDDVTFVQVSPQVYFQ